MKSMTKVTSSQFRNNAKTQKLTGIIMSIETGSIDVIVLYKLLRIIYENEGISLTKLFEEFRAREGVKVNYTSVRRHIDYAVTKELVKEEKGKPSRLYITKKGIDYMFLVSRVLALLGERLE